MSRPARIRRDDPAVRIVAALFAAIALIATAAPAHAASRAEIDTLLSAASTASREDRHGDAIALYERLLEEAPWRVSEVSGPLAWQYAWSGRLDDARREFARAIALSPEDYELRLGALLVLNWTGRHLAAWRGYDGLHGRDLTRAEPLIGLATAQRWAGRNDLALRSLAVARRVDPDQRDVDRVEASVRSELRPAAGGYHDWSEDSDGYRVAGEWVEGSFSPHPQWRVTPFANALAIRRTGSADLDELWAGLRVVARPWTRVGLRGEGRYLTDREEGADYNPFTGAGSITWTGGDALRGGADVERFAVVSYVRRPDKITGTAYGTWVEFQPDWKSRLRLAGSYASYSDNNARRSAVLTASRYLGSAARLRGGFVARWIEFDRWIDNGIWTPEAFHAGAATLEWELGDRERWSLGGGVEVGPAREKDAGTVLSAAWSIRFVRGFGPVVLEAGAGHSEGDIETGTGYDRSWTHVGLRARF